MKVYLETHGCTSSQAESEILLGHLEGWEQVDTPEKADLVVLNTCFVKATTQRRMLRRIGELSGKPFIVAGCLPQAQPEEVQKAAPKASLLGLMPDRILEVAEKTVRGEKVVLLGTNGDKVCLPKKRASIVVGRIPISEGCLGNCSYCCTKLARGDLRSYSSEKIVAEIKQGLKQGLKEFWLTSQDNSVYGFDNKTTIAALLDGVAQLEGEFRVRVGMMNPGHLMKNIDKVLDVWDPRFFRFFHIPVQSGDNQVLKDMNRPYKAEDFIELVKTIRKKLPDASISTDIICGYPTEDEDAWENSMELIQKARPNVMNISRYEHRPGTRAERLKELPGKVTKARSRQIYIMSRKLALEFSKKFVGTTQTVLIDELGKKSGNVVGRTDNYLCVATKGRVGEFVKVKIREAYPHYLV